MFSNLDIGSKNKTRMYKCRDERGEQWSINFLHFSLKNM